MRSDTSLRPPRTPRGLIVSTGEDIPRGHAVRARTFILELSPSDLRWDLLSDCQRDAAAGVYSMVMSAYLHWVAPQYAKLRAMLPRTLAEGRAAAAGSTLHKRTQEIVAHLVHGPLSFSAVRAIRPSNICGRKRGVRAGIEQIIAPHVPTPLAMCKLMHK